MTDIGAQRQVVTRALNEIVELRRALEAGKNAGSEPIAVVGMACRVPGAVDSTAYWELLREGRDAITDVPSSRWDAEAYYSPDSDAPGKICTTRAGIVEGLDEFDASFFGISPREAAHMDPQQRMFLQVGWEALEDAGLAASRLANTETGVFVGVTGFDYSHNLLNSVSPSQLDAYVMTGLTSTFAAGRMSYWLGLHGPSLSLDTACSSSLVAVHLACQSLRAEECSVALAGGVNALLTPAISIVLSRAKMLSPDGACKTFDASANGYVRSEGCGVVVLKRLSSAVADNDRILAVIRGSAVNQDGRSSGITVPNAQAQQAVIRKALTVAGVPGSRIGYVEAHGTGTRLGDPIEVRALSAVLGKGRDGGSPIFLGSAKSNIGHLEAAAGVAGLIKTILTLQHGQIPPLAHLRTINPEIGATSLPVTFPTRLTDWPRTGEPRVAGVSSFGASGTNAHLVVEEAPRVEDATPTSDRPEHLVTLSARSDGALRELAKKYARLPENGPALADVAFTANTGRTHFGHRISVRADSLRTLRDRLEGHLAHDAEAGVHVGTVGTNAKPKVGFLFTGQGAQHAGMARRLYETDPGFRADLQACDTLLRTALDKPLLSVMFGDGDQNPDGSESLINDTRYTQPAMFSLQYALASLWLRWGVHPAAMSGHSVGEFAAACAAGVFTLEEGLALVAERGRLMAELPAGGAMATVFAPLDRVTEAIQAYEGELAVAAVNGPEHVVISGSVGALNDVVGRLATNGFQARTLRVSHAFHSPLMDPMLDAFEKHAAQITYQPPTIPVVSTLTGRMADGHTFSAGYLREHARAPVRFSDALHQMIDLGCTAFIEIGPSPQLCGIAMNDHRGPYHWLPSLRRGHDDWTTLLESVGELYVTGADIDWAAVDRGHQRRRVGLPTYPFERTRHWFTASVPPGEAPGEAPADRAPSRHEQPADPVPATTLLGRRLPSPLATIQFQADLTTDTHPGIADCLTAGIPIVNAGFYVEAVVQAAEELYGATRVRISDVIMPKALITPSNGQVCTQLVVTDEDDQAAFSYYSREPEGDGWMLHAEGVFTAEANGAGDLGAAGPDITAIADRCGSEVSGFTFYRSLWSRGIQLGPSAQWLTRIVRRDGEALAWLRPPDESEGIPGYHLHPGVIDSALQLLFACRPRGLRATDVIILLELGDYTFFGYDGTPLLCHAVTHDEPGGTEILTADIVLMTEAGEIVARMRDVRMRSTSRQALMSAINAQALRGASARPARRAPRAVAAHAKPGGSVLDLLHRGEETAARDAVRRVLMDCLTTVLGTPATEIDPDVVLQELGLDSLLAVELRQQVASALSTTVPTAWFLDSPSVSRLENRIVSSLRDRDSAGSASPPPRARHLTGPGGMRIVEYGSGEPIVFVHGGGFGGPESWQTQIPLADRWRLLIVSRPGYEDSPSEGPEDWITDGRLLADLLEEHRSDGGVHLVAHSYGTLGAMHAAAARPTAVRSLTLIESGASVVARGVSVVDEYERTMRDLTSRPPEDPDAFIRAFFRVIDPTADYSRRLPASLQAYAKRAVVAGGVHWPWECDLIPERELREAAFPKLVVTGGGRPVFEAISDALAERLSAERVVVPGGHGTQNAGEPFNRVLEDLLSRAGRIE